ncbi:hypothetical protein P280DRAFT_316618 [Massarina eburnea CBS 473.64]|uniref:Uncharacterized protein n=1 Tax=Massarina eburnea CBS 473.64 TaxID=1395130 RepID=A0A6A6S145_9PLEO|nr:hypothetical protein P280DRAFT_316618 [Massarina eburnea CBS 473.64]
MGRKHIDGVFALSAQMGIPPAINGLFSYPRIYSYFSHDSTPSLSLSLFPFSFSVAFTLKVLATPLVASCSWMHVNPTSNPFRSLFRGSTPLCGSTDSKGDEFEIQTIEVGGNLKEGKRRASTSSCRNRHYCHWCRVKNRVSRLCAVLSTLFIHFQQSVSSN